MTNLLVCLAQAGVVIEDHEAAGSYNGKKDLVITNDNSHTQVKIDLGYPNSSLLASVILPDGHQLFAVGLMGGSGELWLAKYDIISKKRIAKYDALLKSPGISGIPQSLIWNAKDKILELTLDAPEAPLLLRIDTVKNKIIEKKTL